MASIRQIHLRLVTASVIWRSTGTKGDAFLGLAGREFYVNDGNRAFERGATGATSLVRGPPSSTLSSMIRATRNSTH